MTKTQRRPEIPKGVRQAAVMTVTVEEPSAESRRVVGRVLQRALRDNADERRDRIIMETPGVLEGFDAALEELAALKRSR